MFCSRRATRGLVCIQQEMTYCRGNITAPYSELVAGSVGLGILKGSYVCYSRLPHL